MDDGIIPLPPLIDISAESLLENILVKCGAEVITRTLYRGVEGLYAEGMGGWIWIGIDNDHIVVRGKGAFYNRVKTCLKEALLDAYYYSGRAHIYFIYAGRESLYPRLRETLPRKIARKLFAENMVYMFFIAAVISMIVYKVFGPLLAPLALTLVAFAAIVISPFILPPLLSDWRLSPGEKVRILDISIPGEIYKEIYTQVNREKLAKVKAHLWSYIKAGIDVESKIVGEAFSEILGISSIPGIRVKQKEIDVYRALKMISRRLKAPLPRGVYLYNVVAKNALSMGLRGASSIIITTGLLAFLEEKEVAAVLGHEESHLYRMDLLLFTAAASAEYAFRLYYFFIYRPELLLDTPLIIGYLVLTGTLMFLLAKLLELRADVDVARVGLAASLASSLTKIGYPLLLEKKSIAARLLEWLSWRPHPPLRYRVACAEKLALNPPRRVWVTALTLLIRGLLTVA